MDVRGFIANYIEQKVRDLLEYDMNEYQDPAWVQAAELFNEVVVPCDAYYSEGLYTLGIDIVKEAEDHGCRVVYQKIPGMYNVKLVPEGEYSGEEVEKVDYSRTVKSIKSWIAENAKWF
jgi:hypothetical protein